MSARRPASLAGRLLGPLLAVVAVVMLAFATWALVQRERTLVAEARRETRAYATALELALEAGFREPGLAGVQEIVNRVSLEPSIYAVLVYDSAGARLFEGTGPEAALPAPSEVVARVLTSAAPEELDRTEGDLDVYSVVRPVRDEEGRVVGAFEVLQPLSFVAQDKAGTRVRFLLNTLVLLSALTTLILWLVRRYVATPLAGLTEHVRALGAGRLEHRVDPRHAVGELAVVAEELNLMAKSLEEARTDLLASTEERVHLERQVRRSERMALTGRLAAGLAHEIGAPLHVIRGRADLLLKRTGLERESRDLSIIAEQIDRITKIVQNLLDFARQREPDLAPMDLVSLVDGALELVATELDSAAVRAVRVGDGSVAVTGDRDQLQQVLLNLLINAVHALREVPGDRVLTVSVTTAESERGRVARMAVTDSGPGVAASNRERVFEPFFTTKGEGAGTGLGLAVARRIVEEHGGSLELVSGGTGSTFIVTLPAEQEVAVDA